MQSILLAEHYKSEIIDPTELKRSLDQNRDIFWAETILSFFNLTTKVTHITQLHDALFFCSEFSYFYNLEHRLTFDYKEINRYINIIIELSKIGINLKCKYMSRLIQMYEYYYFDLYILKFMQQIEDKYKGLFKDMTENKLNYMVNNDKLNLLSKEWSHNNSIKMNCLLKIIKMEYDDEYENLMEELNGILDFVRVKYKIIATVLNNCMKMVYQRYNEEVVEMDNERRMHINKMIPFVVKLIYSIPAGATLIASIPFVKVYGLIFGDDRDIIDIVHDDVFLFLFPWVIRQPHVDLYHLE